MAFVWILFSGTSFSPAFANECPDLNTLDNTARSAPAHQNESQSESWVRVHDDLLLSNPSCALSLGQQLLQKSAEALPTNQRVKIQIQNAYAHELLGDPAEAYKELENIRATLTAEQSDLRAAVLHSLGNIYFQTGDHDEAVTYYYQALDIREKLGDLRAASYTVNNIANVLLKSGHYQESIHYYEHVAELGLRLHDLQLQGDGAQGVALVELAQHHWALAKENFEKALAYFSSQDPNYWGALAASVGLAEIALHNNNPVYGKNLFAAAFARAETTKLKSLQLELLTHMARAYVETGAFANALPMIEKAIALASETNDQRGQLDALLILALAQQGLKHDAEAFQTMNKWRLLNEQLATESTARHAELLQVRYGVQQKELEIQALTQKAALQQAELIQEQLRKQITIAVLVMAALIMGSALIYFTHRREIKRMHQVSQQLRELDRLKDQVLANTSHELRTPLNGIVGLSDLLLLEELPPEQRKCVEMIADSGRRLSHVVNDLLEFARLKQGKEVLRTQELRLQNAVEQCLSLCRPLIGNKPVQIINEVNADCPTVRAAPDRVQQILINLVNNAIKFTDAGVVKINARVDGEFVRISLSDSGIGISREQHERIFEAFEQADGSMSRHHQGAGLGLAICKQLIELHGGHIGVDSTVGVGSTFWFTLPLYKPMSS